jgi:hypothetical protein
VLLLHVGFCTPSQFVRLQIFDMGGDPPMIAGWVDDAGGTVSIELVRWLHL